MQSRLLDPEDWNIKIILNSLLVVQKKMALQSDTSLVTCLIAGSVIYWL